MIEQIAFSNIERKSRLSAEERLEDRAREMQGL